jgi:hypothetical protein
MIVPMNVEELPRHHKDQLRSADTCGRCEYVNVHNGNFGDRLAKRVLLALEALFLRPTNALL